VIQNKQQVAEEDIDEEGACLDLCSPVFPSPPAYLVCDMHADNGGIDAVKSHRKLFGGSEADSGSTSASQLGSAAAVQALKLFTSGDQKGQSQSQSAFVGLAMAQAAKLFDQQAAKGNVAAGEDKQSAVMKAGELALKMYLKSYGSGSSQGSSGFGGLLGMASKFVQ
jgi:hypothetical protein